MEDLYKIASALFSTQCKHPPTPPVPWNGNTNTAKVANKKNKSDFFFYFLATLKKKKKKFKNNVVLVPKSRKRYLGITLEVKNGFVFQGFIITSGKKNPKKPVKVALLVFDTVTEIHRNIGKRKRSFTKKLGLKSSALLTWI